jgi:hypothetical protein
MNTPIHELPAAAGLSDAARCVVLGLEQCALLLAQSEVLALEPVLDARRPAAELRNATAMVQVAGEDCAVYSLDGDLNCLPTLPPRHRICAVLNHASGPFALSCSEVRMVERSALTLHPLPRAFAARSGPLRALVGLEGRLLLGTTAAALLAHLAQPRAADVISFDAHARKARP